MIQTTSITITKPLLIKTKEQYELDEAQFYPHLKETRNFEFVDWCLQPGIRIYKTDKEIYWYLPGSSNNSSMHIGKESPDYEKIWRSACDQQDLGTLLGSMVTEWKSEEFNPKEGDYIYIEACFGLYDEAKLYKVVNGKHVKVGRFAAWLYKYFNIKL